MGRYDDADDGTDPYVFTSGHRSPQGLLVTPGGEPMEIGFNSNYLLDIARQIEGENAESSLRFQTRAGAGH